MTFWPLPHISFPRIRQRDTRPIPVEVLAAAQATPQRCPIGLNVRQDVNYAEVLAYVKRLGGVSAILFHCDTGNLGRLRDFLPYADMVIWRPRMFTDERLHEDTNAHQWTADRRSELAAAGFKDGEVWLHLTNEPGWSTKLVTWTYEACDYGLPYGMRFVVFNCAVGTPEPEQIGMAQQVIALGGQFPDRIRTGLHEYFSVYGNRKDKWYLERWSFWEQYRVDHGLPPIKYVITEFGAEDISDDHAYTDTLPRPGNLPADEHIGPVKTLDSAWAATYNNATHNQNPKPYPGLDTAYMQQIDIAFSVGAYYRPEIAGVCLFGWGKNESRWVNYDISDMTVFQEELAAWTQRYWRVDPAPIDPLPEETPMIITPGDYILHATAGYVNLRAGAGTDKAVLTRVPDAATVTLTGNSDKPSTTLWIELEYLGQRGWMAVVQPGTAEEAFAAQFTRVVVTPPAPPPTGEYVTPEQLQAALDAQAKALRVEFGTLVIDLVKIYGEGQLAAQERIAEFIGVAA